jgi:hypothetical protein
MDLRLQRVAETGFSEDLPELLAVGFSVLAGPTLQAGKLPEIPAPDR